MMLSGHFLYEEDNTMSKNTDEMNLTQEEKNEVIRTYEDDILGGLLKAANFRDDPDEIHPVEIVRNNVCLIKFHIHPLSEEELVDCRKRHTKYMKHKATGARIAESVDGPAFRSEAIYLATTEEDREKIWDNKKAWKELAVFNGIAMIDAVLKGGEKDAVYDKIEEISAYNSDLDETTKN